MDILETPVRRLTPLVAALRLLETLDIDRGCWIAGGAARAVYEGENLPANSDIDVFGATPDDLDRSSKDIESRLRVTANSPLPNGSKTIKGVFTDLFEERLVTVQIIRGNYYPSLEDLFRDIDFTVAQFVTDGHVIRYTADAERDLRDRVLRVEPAYLRKRTRPTRLIKYLNKGFTPLPGIVQWSLDLGNPKTTAMNLGLVYDY